MDRGAWRATVHAVAKSWRGLSMSKMEYWENYFFLGPTLKTECELARGNVELLPPDKIRAF